MLNGPVKGLWQCTSSFKTTDTTNGLRGDDFEAILDVLKDTEEVEEQCAVIVPSTNYDLSHNF